MIPKCTFPCFFTGPTFQQFGVINLVAPSLWREVEKRKIYELRLHVVLRHNFSSFFQSICAQLGMAYISFTII